MDLIHIDSGSFVHTNEKEFRMAEGHIKWYSEKKGYGFVSSPIEGDLFLHHTNIKKFGHFGLQEGDPVTFDVVNTPKGKQAVNLQPAKTF